MGFIPFIGNVPALGAPYRLTLTAHRAVEQTAGLVVAAAPPSLSGGGAGPNLNDPPGLDPTSVATSGGTTWNNRQYLIVSTIAVRQWSTRQY
jgi:hypothetical protein